MDPAGGGATYGGSEFGLLLLPTGTTTASRGWTYERKEKGYYINYNKSKFSRRGKQRAIQRTCFPELPILR